MCSSEILVFGGTTEGKNTIRWLSELSLSFFYSTKTSTTVLLPAGSWGMKGIMSEEDIAAFCFSRNIRLIIDAAHPHAKKLHDNIYLASLKTGLPVLRVERELYPRKENPLICYVDSLHQLLEDRLIDNAERIVSLLGVNSVSLLHNNLAGKKIWYRILDQENSRKKALSCGVREKQILPAEKVDDFTDIHKLIVQRDIQLILTKESGVVGGFDRKCDLAVELGIPLLVLKRPRLPDFAQTVWCRDDFCQYLKTFFDS